MHDGPALDDVMERVMNAATASLVHNSDTTVSS